MAGGDLSTPIEIPAARELPAPRAESALREVWRLLEPRILAARNRSRRMTRAEKLQMRGFVFLGILFGAGIFYLFRRALTFFLAAEDFGPVLTYKLLGMVFITFFSILLFSNIVTSLSTFFLARELDRIVAAPVPMRRFFYARFIDTVVDSSWMMLLFSLPAFVAYGVVHETGWRFYVATAATIPPFLIIPAAIGASITTVLVNAFPARRTKDILLLLSIVAVALLYLIFRMVRPEQLVNPEGFQNFMAFLAAMQTPDSVYLPSTWATEILYSLLGIRDGSPLFYWALLTSTAGVALFACEAVMSRLFLPGWSKAQEGRQARFTQRALWERALGIVTWPFPAQMRLLMVKEVKTFFRDTSQWSQLILLLALVVVYVYNFSVLPLQGNPLMQFFLKNVISFLNLALAGFVVASVAARFVFPSFSLEGKAFWIVKTAPLSLRRLWWTKFWVNLVPLIVLGELLVILTNNYLQVIPFVQWLSILTLALMVPTIVMLGLAFGAAYPKFDADNAAKVAASVGGLVYMVTCMSYIGLVVLLEAFPVYWIFESRFRGQGLSALGFAGCVTFFGAVLVLTAAVLGLSVRHGQRKLEALLP